MKLARHTCCVVIAAAVTSTASAGEAFSALWDRIKNDRPEEIAGSLERFVLERPIERDRRLALRALAEASSKAIPPWSPEEWWTVESIRRERPELSEIVAGRSTILVCTPSSAEAARRDGLATRLDLAALMLRDWTGCDPVGARRHRWYVFADAAQHGNLRTAYDWLGIFVPWDLRADAYPFEALCHEMMHAFIADHPSKHLFAGGFGEGWADFAPAFVCERLASLGAPYAGRFDALAGEFEEASRVEYLDTRLPIEEIVAYGPSSGFLAQLARSARIDGQGIDWTAWFELLRARGPTTLPVSAGQLWPARQAHDWLAAFGRERALPILRRFRFPTDDASGRDVENALASVANLEPPNAEVLRSRWHALGSRVVDGWRVLGPIPDREDRGLEFDPLDSRNFVPRESHEYGGVTYRWRDDVRPDEYGTLKLDELGGGSEPCVLYLLRSFDENDPAPAELSISSDDRAVAWLDGREVLRQTTTGRCDVFEPLAGFGEALPKRRDLVVEIAQDGGRCWFHARTNAKSPLIERTRLEMASDDAERRQAALVCASARRSARPALRDLLVEALGDKAPSVRARAAFWLAGQRGDARIVDALRVRFARERDSAAHAAIQSALEELCLTAFATSDEASRWWHDNQSAFAAWSFVECEQAVGDGRQSGGFHGNNAGSFGRQCLGRAWGSNAADWFSVDLVARAKGSRKLALRYVQCDSNDARLDVAVRRGDQVVWRGMLSLPRTETWSSWRWTEVETSPLEAGTYIVRVTATPDCGSPDLDVIGWR